MDHELDIHRSVLPVGRRPRQDWPWCKGFIVEGVLYSSEVAGGDPEEDRDFVDMPRSSQRSRAPLP